MLRPNVIRPTIPKERVPDAQLAVLLGATHMEVIRRTDALGALVEPFLAAASQE